MWQRDWDRDPHRPCYPFGAIPIVAHAGVYHKVPTHFGFTRERLEAVVYMPT